MLYLLVISYLMLTLMLQISIYKKAYKESKIEYIGLRMRTQTSLSTLEYSIPNRVFHSVNIRVVFLSNREDNSAV